MRSFLLLPLILMSLAVSAGEGARNRPLVGKPNGGTTAHIFSTWKDNPHCHHTFFAPTAIPLPQGQGYYSNSYIIMHSAWFAPLDNSRSQALAPAG